MVSNFFGPNASSATGSRLNVESIFFNQIPILDANFFNFESAGGYSLTTTTMYQPASASGLAPYEVTQVNKSNIVYQLRSNLRKWYVIIRNASIAILLFVLIYLGIRYAISTTGEKKANIKNLLVSWVTAFIIVLFIHIFMYMVFQINDTLVGICRDIGQNFASTSLEDQAGQQLNLYDAVRVKAYAFSFREGIPATIIYIYMIYLLIRFSYIYFKRYITVYILAIMGSFMGVKYAIEKIAGKKSTSFGKWFKDFAFNVLLQTVHAFIYVIYMGIAINSASESLAGFVLCLIILNFMLNADKIVMKIFGLDKASSIADVIRPESYLQLVAKFTPIWMVSSSLVKNANKFILGKRGLVKEVQYSLKGFDNYKDAEKYFENVKYNKIGDRQQRIDKILGKLKYGRDQAWNKMKNTRFGGYVTDKGLSIKEMLNKRGIKGFDLSSKFKNKYADKRRKLNTDIPLEMKRAIFNSIKKSKEFERKKFTRPLGLAKDLVLMQAGVTATVALAIADPAGAVKTFNSTKKLVSKHRTLSSAKAKNHVYRDRKVEEKQKYRKSQLQFRTSALKYVNDKFGYNDQMQKLKSQYNSAGSKKDKAEILNQMKQLEKNRTKDLNELVKQLGRLQINGTSSTDPELSKLQKQFKDMYDAKSDIRLDADYKKTENSYKEKVEAYVNGQYDYQTKIEGLKRMLSGTSNSTQAQNIKDQIKKLEKEKRLAEAKGKQEIKEAVEKMEQEKILYKNARYERNHISKALGAVTGASILADMAQNEIEGRYNDRKGADKELKKLNDLEKMSNDELALKGYMEQIKSGYDSDEEAQADMAGIIGDARKTVIKSSTIKSVISKYMYDNNVKHINTDNIDDILDKLSEALKEYNYGIIISGKVKSEVKKQLEEKMIEDSKGLGLDKKDATVAIGTILGEEGMIETIVDRSEVRKAVSSYMNDNNSTTIRTEDIDNMISSVEDTLRTDIPNNVKDEIKNKIEETLTKDEYRNGVDKSVISKIINSEIKENNIESTSRYHKSLTKEQIDELKAEGIAINTEEYYQYLTEHNIQDVAKEKARNEARQKARDISVRNENAKIKHGSSLVDVKKVLYESI